MFPRFQQENMEKNKVLYDRVAALAESHGCTSGQLALAWLLHQGDDVVPIPGKSEADKTVLIYQSTAEIPEILFLQISLPALYAQLSTEVLTLQFRLSTMRRSSN
jgi:hypothetical protein